MIESKRLVYPACIAVVLLALLTVGCSIFPEPRETYYYAIEYEPPPEMPQGSSIGVVRVFEPSVAPAYDRRQIVLRGDTARYQYLSDDMWGVELRDSLQMLLERYHEEAGTYSSVLGEFDRGVADHEIHSAIRRLEYVDGDTPHTRVELVFEARATEGSSRTVARHHVDHDEPTSGNGGLERFADDVNRVILEAIYEFDSKIREAADDHQAGR